MKTYRVFASYVVELYHDVEAESVEDAYDKAYYIDGGDYTRMQDNDGGWQIDGVQELDEPYTCPKFEPAQEEV